MLIKKKCQQTLEIIKMKTFRKSDGHVDFNLHRGCEEAKLRIVGFG